MDAPLYVEMLGNTLLPFVWDTFPDGHWFMQDNDLKHTREAVSFFESNIVHWWKTAAESLNLNSKFH